MKQSAVILVLLGLVVGLPFLFREDRPATQDADTTVVVITPHTESIRIEFARGFAQWYRERTGRTVYLDYRVVGGTSEIAKFLESAYTSAFKVYWENELGRQWNFTVQEAFDNPRIVPDESPEDDTVAQAARRTFLSSNVSSGMDVFFGGGAYDFTMQAINGNLIDGGLLEKFPEWFMETAPVGEIPPAIPRVYAGETYYDAEGRWYGTCLSSYGILFNRPALRRLGIETEPRQWQDLADPRLFGQVAVSDPTKSGSIAQAFEMLVQQQMQWRLAELDAQDPTSSPEEREARAIRDGWERGLCLVQLIAANARYFTDNSQKPSIDVAMGDCAAGMSIDFYGRFQQESVLERARSDRFGFVVPRGGTTISVDPIGMLRGAPHREVAEQFLEYVLSLEGQKLWNFKVGAPGGPVDYALRRPPIRPELYLREWNSDRSDASVIPYEAARDFQYRGDWTGGLFDELRTLIRVCFIDVRPELVDAWAAILHAREEGRFSAADQAFSVFSNLDRISYDEATTTIDAALKAPPIDEVRLARELSIHFREQFQEAARIARGR